MVKLMHVYLLTNLCVSLCLALPQFLNNHVLDSITVFYFTLSMSFFFHARVLECIAGVQPAASCLA